MSTSQLFSLNRPTIKLNALGFRYDRDHRGWAYRVMVDDIEVTATMEFDSIMLNVFRAARREVTEIEVRIPLLASFREYADAFAKVLANFYPDNMNKDALWADTMVSIAKSQRPSVLVNRELLRREIKTLKSKVMDTPPPDARIDYHDNQNVRKAGELTIRIGDAVAKFHAKGVWVGTIWVKPRDLFKGLNRRFMRDPALIKLHDNNGPPGKWLWIGNQIMRAGWEPLQEHPSAIK